MQPTSIRTKVAGLLFALLMSATVLGATVAGMASGGQGASEVFTLDRTVVLAPSATRVN